jgi:hypothetical protein
MSLPAYSPVGSYPLFYTSRPCEDWEVYCPTCATEAELSEQDAHPNWEDASVHCDQCGARIESAYAEEEGDA